MKILHLTYWFPHKEQPQAGIFIKNHIDGLNDHCQNEVIHIQVKPSSKLWSKETNGTALIYNSRLAKYYRFQEFITERALKRILKQKDIESFDAINIHIATPLGKHINFIQEKYKKPVLVTEHWTAYYRFFGLDKNHPGLQRTKDIFKQNFKLITVSKALGIDIQRFAYLEKLDFTVIPNIINTDIFRHKSLINQSFTLFMLTNWSPEKNPFLIFNALAKYNLNFTLNIGGDGILLEKMKVAVKELGLNKRINFLGRISPEQAAEQFQKSHVFLHSSHYETFSVVCAEALCCGCPVIASNIPAIEEYLDQESGILVKDFEESDELEVQRRWDKAIEALQTKQFNRETIAAKFSKRFGKKEVSKLYYTTIKEYVEG